MSPEPLPVSGSGQELFASADGTFRIIFVKARGELNGYRECTDWFNAVKSLVNTASLPDATIKIGYTGRPVYSRRKFPEACGTT